MGIPNHRYRVDDDTIANAHPNYKTFVKATEAANLLNDLLDPHCALHMQGRRVGRHEN